MNGCFSQEYYVEKNSVNIHLVGTVLYRNQYSVVCLPVVLKMLGILGTYVRTVCSSSEKVRRTVTEYLQVLLSRPFTTTSLREQPQNAGTDYTLQFYKLFSFDLLASSV